MKLLIIEDNRDIAENIADYFEPKGHALDFAYDGAQGLALAEQTQFDAIVLDIMLPKITGFQVCTRLRTLENYTPIIMLTARDQLDDKLQGFASGADDYLVKPFSVKELEARLHALLNRLRREKPEAKLQLADLIFDIDQQTIGRAGQLIDLNPTQKKILLCLLQHSPNVVSRQALEELIWGEEPPDKDILRTHIYSLRNQIDRPFEKKLLHTVHGVGYRLVAD